MSEHLEAPQGVARERSAVRKHPKLAGLIGWTLLCFFGGIYVASQTKDNSGQAIMTGALIFWIVGLIVWAFILFKRLPGETRHAINSTAITFVALIIFVIVGGSIWASSQMAVKPSPTSPNVWQVALTTLGVSDLNTPKPTQQNMEGFVCGRFPKTDRSAELCKKAAVDLLKDDLQSFQNHWAKNSALVVQNADKKAAEAVRIQPATFEVVVTWTILESIIAAFFSISIDGLGKAKWGTLIWAALGGFIVFAVIGGMPTDAEASLFGIGAIMRGVATLVAFLGLGLTIAKGAIKGSSAGSRFFLRIVFAVVGGVLGCFAESLLQMPIITQYVADGHISMNAAWAAYQFGLMFGGGITAIISTALLMAQAALAK